MKFSTAPSSTSLGVPNWIDGPVALTAAAVGFAMFNAFSEEMLWRGAISDSLANLLGPSWAAVGLVAVVQALSFGLAHFNGIPWGWSGVALTTVFGLATFALRLRYASLWPAIAVHIIADYGIERVYLDIA